MKKKLAIAINLFVGIMSICAWSYMAFFKQDAAALSSSSISSLKYFTVLSNLFNGVVSIGYVYWRITDKEMNVSKKTWKLTATAAVGLTFATVMGFLGPLYGYGMMFHGANFWMHLVLPVLSIVSFVILERDCKIPFRNTFCVCLAPLLYEIGYVGNIIIHGKGEWPDTNDFYGFLNWGNYVGAIIAFCILVITWGIAWVLYRAGKMYQSQKITKRV